MTEPLTHAQQLREHVEIHETGGGSWYETPEVCLEAAAEIDRLAADNARLTKERDKERKHVARLMRDLDHNRKRAEAAEARIRAMEVKP